VRKDFLSLNWDILLTYLQKFIRTESAKDYVSKYEPSFSLQKALILKEESNYLLNLFNSGIDIEIPNLPSIRNILDTAEKRGLLLPKELSKICLFIKFIRINRKLLVNSPFGVLVELSAPLEETFERLELIFNLETGDFSDKASYSLYLIRKKIQNLKDELFTKLEKLIEHYTKLGFLQEPIYLVKEGRYVLPVKPEFKNKIKGIVHGFSQSGATVFVEPFSIVVLTNELNELLWEEEREINRLLREITNELLREKERFTQLERELVRLDVAQARVRLGKLYNGILPEFTDSERLEIEEGVHPLLYLRALEGGGTFPVANNFYLTRALLITGPNLGGKTVSLKTIGLYVLMAYGGFLLPAKRAKIPFLQDVLVDIGDDQNLMIGESSFSAHLRNLLRIVKRANEKSLVLLDEPGRGTNPDEGSALVCAIIERLLKRGAKLVVTTHSQAIKGFLSNSEGALIGTMEFDHRTHQPTYRLLLGYWGDSHALKLAKKLGFDEEILKRAEELLENQEYYQWQKRYLEEIEKIEQMKKELSEKTRQLELEREKIRKLKEKLQEELNRAIEKIYTDWQKEFQELINKISEEKSIKKAREEFRNFLRERTIKFEEGPQFSVGERVRIGSTAREGEILAIKENIAIVACGPFKLEIPLCELKKIGQKAETVTSSKNLREKKEETSFKQEKLNLIGETVESALNILEKKINECFLRGVNRLLVIHGHGTGRLRSSIREYLSKHPLIESIEDAPPSAGGSGATLVSLAEAIKNTTY